MWPDLGLGEDAVPRRWGKEVAVLLPESSPQLVVYRPTEAVGFVEQQWIPVPAIKIMVVVEVVPAVAVG